MNALGNNVITMFGMRADKDTAPSAWVRMWARSNSLKANFEKAKDEALTGSRISEAGFVSAISISGEINENLNKSSLELLKASGFDKTEDVEKYTYSLGETMNKWADFIKFHNDTKLKEFYEKCRVNSVSFDIQNKAFIGINWNIEGIETRRSLASSFTEAPSGFIKAERVKSLDTAITIAGSDKSGIVKNMSITLNNNLDADNYGFGSKNRTDIDVSDVASIEFSATLSFDNSEYDAYRTALENDSTISIEVVMGEITVKLNQVSLSDVSAPVSGRGKIELSISGTAHSGALAPMIIEVSK